MLEQEQILVIDDDLDVAELVFRQLESLGCIFEHATDGISGLDKALKQGYSLVIVDLGLPKMGGLEVCRRLREAKPLLPILILTGEKGEVNTVLGFEVGADEYIVKPFQALEFQARIKSLLRRAKRTSTGPSEATDNTPPVNFKDLKIDFDLRKVSCGPEVGDLTAAEFDLFLFFLQNPKRVISRDQIVEVLWGENAYAYEQNVRTTISRLRSKLDLLGKRAPYIVTERGFGYRLATEND